MPRTRRRSKPLGARNRSGRLSQRRHKAKRPRPAILKRGAPWHWREPGPKTHDLSRLAERRLSQGQSPPRQARSNGRKSLSGTRRGAGPWKIRRADVGTYKPAPAGRSRTASLSVALPLLSPAHSMHGGGQRSGCFKSSAAEGLRTSYYMKYGPESWKNFPVREIDAYPARYSGPGTSPAIYCVFESSSLLAAHFPI